MFICCGIAGGLEWALGALTFRWLYIHGGGVKEDRQMSFQCGGSDSRAVVQLLVLLRRVGFGRRNEGIAGIKKSEWISVVCEGPFLQCNITDTNQECTRQTNKAEPETRLFNYLS